jgi:hypothetical protein
MQQGMQQGMHQRMQSMMHRPGMSAAAHEQGLHIRMRRGDMAIDLRCPASADYSSCISAVGQLVDKLGPASSSGRSGTGSTAPTPDTPSTR